MTKPKTTSKKGRPSKDEERPTITIRLSQDLKEKIEREAKAEHRSRAAHIELILENYFREKRGSTEVNVTQNAMESIYSFMSEKVEEGKLSPELEKELREKAGSAFESHEQRQRTIHDEIRKKKRD